MKPESSLSVTHRENTVPFKEAQKSRRVFLPVHSILPSERPAAGVPVTSWVSGSLCLLPGLGEPDTLSPVHILWNAHEKGKCC